MKCSRRGLGVGFCALMLWGTMARADLMVQYATQDLGGGLFQYNLTVINQGGMEPLSGLSILQGNSLFGLDSFSTISTPTGWSDFAPLPPLVDNLDYFSLDSTADIPIGGTLGGFSFQSTTAPATVSGGFDTVLVTAVTNTQIPVTATPVPEPTSGLLILVGLFGLGIARGRDRVGQIRPRCKDGGRERRGQGEKGRSQC